MDIQIEIGSTMTRMILIIIPEMTTITTEIIREVLITLKVNKFPQHLLVSQQVQV